MKILAINGSNRGDKGHTGFLIDQLFQGATAMGATCESVVLSEHKINRCLACEKCHTDEQYLTCVYKTERDDVAAIFDKIAQADLLVFATPVYIFGVSGLLKIFLERMYATGDVSDLCVTQSGLVFHDFDEETWSKPFVSLICCDNIEDLTPSNAIHYFRTYARFMDTPHVGELVRNSGLMVGYGRDPEKMQRFPKIEAVYAAYVEAGRELATEGRISQKTQRCANQEIIPMPLFSVLKRLPFRFVKQKFVEQARAKSA